jgi:hypothetical protein
MHPAFNLEHLRKYHQSPLKSRDLTKKPGQQLIDTQEVIGNFPVSFVTCTSVLAVPMTKVGEG